VIQRGFICAPIIWENLDSATDLDARFDVFFSSFSYSNFRSFSSQWFKLRRIFFHWLNTLLTFEPLTQKNPEVRVAKRLKKNVKSGIKKTSNLASKWNCVLYFATVSYILRPMCLSAMAISELSRVIFESFWVILIIIKCIRKLFLTLLKCIKAYHRFMLRTQRKWIFRSQVLLGTRGTNEISLDHRANPARGTHL